MPLPETSFPPALAENEPANAAMPSAETLRLLALRRSTKVILFTDPGPNRHELDLILRLATHVPDHGKLGPWRFVIIEGDARVRAGEALARVLEAGGDAEDQQLKAAQETFTRAPVCVMVVSTAAPHVKIPEWEQHLSAGAACFALLTSAHALGYAGCWLTGWPVYDARARAALGLADSERIAGFIHLGTAAQQPVERQRPELATRITRF